MLADKMMLAELIANYINTKRKELGLSIKDIADATNDQAPESTVKNLCHKKTDNPGVGTLKYVMDAIGGSFDEMLYPERTKSEVSEAAVLAQKELYEHQLATLKETNESHIANIRAHYEQHHKDLVDNFEKRLADKRDLNEALRDQITKQETAYTRRIKELVKGTVIRNWIITVFVMGVIALLILEFIHPAHGWIRW